MLWKDKLCIGSDIIDRQHKELFEKTEELLNEVNGKRKDKRQKCISTILFLKEYAVRHFANEEAYMQSIDYADYAEHEKLHVKFVQNVLQHEKRMIDSDFDEKNVKSFTGMLVAWLLYHVADADQKLKKGIPTPDTKPSPGFGDKVRRSVSNTLHKMAGVDPQAITLAENHSETFEDAYILEVELTGGVSGYIIFVFPLSFIGDMIFAMMSYKPEAIGELELSALYETASIISGGICDQIAAEKGVVCDISAPFHSKRMPSIRPDETVALDTGMGIVEVDIAVSQK